MSNLKKTVKPTISVFTLVMINVIAIDSIRGIPMGAHYGFSLVFYYIIAGLLFFIPSALVSAELATALPKTGGIYVWVREAFGAPAGLIVSWIQWIYNICWYPTILSLFAATLAYLINPALASNTFYVLTVVLATYWTLTIITLLGMRASGTISNITAIFGTLTPMLVITVLGGVWLWMGKPINATISWSTLIPDIKSPQNLVFLTAIFYALMGMEMSASHAQEVKNPQRDYPRALFISTIIILLSLILSSLAVAFVLPVKQLDILTGLLDAFLAFFGSFGLGWMMPIMAILIMIGVVGGVSAWMIGPTRGLLVAAQDGSIPSYFVKTNKNHMPTRLLIVQGIILTLICFVYLVMPSVQSSFWILSVITTQLAMSCYLFLFAAAIVLRYKRPDLIRTYKVPFGNVGIWVVGTAGILISLFIIGIGFFPPAGINVGNLFFYESFLIVGIIVFYLIPIVIYRLGVGSRIARMNTEK